MAGLSDFDKTWNESFKNYAIDIARIYKKNPAEIISCLAFGSVSGSLNETYLALVKEKELLPVELLEHSEKIRLWNRAKELTAKQQRRIEVSRSIYLLEQLTNGI